MPFLLALAALLIACKALTDEEPVQSSEPQVVIVNTIVEGRMGADFLSQGFGPFRPGEKTLLAQRKGHGEGLRLPGGGEDGPCIVLRQARQILSLKPFQDTAPTGRD
jgi:hypothetical protein